MASKVVARVFIVNLALSATFLVVACASSSSHDDEYLREAQRAKEAERVDEARTLAELALEEGRRTGEARELLAALSRTRAAEMTEIGDHLRAHSAYLDAADVEPTRSQRGLDLVDALNAADRAGLPDDALIELAQRALRHRPHDVELHREIARLAEDIGEDALAAEHYLWLFSADPDDTHAGLRLGLIYIALDRPADAASVLQRVYNAQPENVQAALNLANVYATLRHHDKAAELFEDLLEQFPNHPAVLRNYADFEERRGDHARARTLREKAGQATPGVERREMRPLR